MTKTSAAAKVYTATCIYCECEITSAYKLPARTMCRAAECERAHAAAAQERRREAARNRRPRRQAVIAGEWGMAAMLSNPSAKR